jgi:hypothetical protein
MHNPGVSRRGTAKACQLARGNSFSENSLFEIRIEHAAHPAMASARRHRDGRMVSSE